MQIINNMITRSQTKQQQQQQQMLYTFEHDFDDSSRAWKTNKRKGKHATYVYVCQNKKNICKRECLAGSEYCKIHFRKCGEKNLTKQGVEQRQSRSNLQRKT